MNFKATFIIVSNTCSFSCNRILTIYLELCFLRVMFCYLCIELPSRSCTNHNSIHLPQSNGNVLLDRRKLLHSSSISAEFLCSVCGDGDLTKFKKCNSDKCLIANFFCKPINPLIKLLVLLHT